MPLMQTLRQPRLWAVALPVLLVLWVMIACADLLKVRGQARSRLQEAAVAAAQTERIINWRRQLGQAQQAAAQDVFEDKTSAGQCAQAAGIPLVRLSRGESATPRQLKDGAIEHTETYRLRAVRLVQAARFVDHAERNFTTVICDQLILTPTGGQDADSWDVTVRLKYRVKPAERPAAT